MEGINDIRLVIVRWYDGNYTQGTMMVIEGDEILYKCKCMELPWVSNQKNVSCIYEGIYNAKKEIHVTRGKVFRLLWVRDREGILIHDGNYVAGYKKDSAGCILPGIYIEDINKDGHPDVAESKKAIDALWDFLPAPPRALCAIPIWLFHQIHSTRHRRWCRSLAFCS